MQPYDLFVIGSGPGGQRAAIQGAKAGTILWPKAFLAHAAPSPFQNGTSHARESEYLVSTYRPILNRTLLPPDTYSPRDSHKRAQQVRYVMIGGTDHG
jgi:hypothetical protein